jgi:hypothetical protein
VDKPEQREKRGMDDIEKLKLVQQLLSLRNVPVVWDDDDSSDNDSESSVDSILSPPTREKGVFKTLGGGWKAMIRHGRVYRIGIYKTKKEAQEAHDQAKVDLGGGFVERRELNFPEKFGFYREHKSTSPRVRILLKQQHINGY